MQIPPKGSARVGKVFTDIAHICSHEAQHQDELQYDTPTRSASCPWRLSKNTRQDS
jgi:hypothetical protein